MSKFFRNRSDERHRKLLAQSFADEDWDQFQAVLEKRPRLAIQQSKKNWSLLHSLVYHPGTPNEIIQKVASLIGEEEDDTNSTRSSYSSSSSSTSSIASWGMHRHIPLYSHKPNPFGYHSATETPLHLCCDRARPDFDRIRILLRYATPENLIQRDTFGRTSFFLACANNVPLDILQSFVAIYPAITTIRDVLNEHPLEIVAGRLQGVVDRAEAAYILEKIVFCATEAWKFRSSCPRYKITSDNRESYLLLAILHVKPTLLPLVSRSCSTACLWMKDAYGDLPIHVVLRLYPKTHYLFQTILDKLVQWAPATARVPSGRTGQLPLHLAVGHCSLDSLLHAYPEAISKVVEKSGLVPFQDAAARNEPVNVIYTLLRSKPDLIRGR